MPRGSLYDGSAARDLYSSTDATATITNSAGESIIGQPLNDSTLWQVWNITYTTASGSTTVRAVPQSVTTDITTGGTASTHITWTAWNDGYTTGTIEGVVAGDTIHLTRATATTDHPIQTISSAGTGNTVLMPGPAWSEWNQNFGRDQVRQAPHGWVRMSREERERWEQREREYEEQRRREREEYEKRIAEERAAREAAEKKAEELLMRHLTPEQRDEYKRLKRFTLHTGGKKYRIQKGWQGNVKLIDTEDDEKVQASYCIHPVTRIPDCDNMLAQKLLLEGSEEEFRRIANETRYA